MENKFNLGTFKLRNKDDKTIESIVYKYFEQGGTCIDTSLFYGGRSKEKLYAKLIQNVKNGTVSTKIGYYEKKSDFRNYHNILDSLNRTLDCYGDKLKVICIHEADWTLWWGCNIGSLTKERLMESPVMRALTRIIDERNDLMLGISGNNSYKIRKIVDFDVFKYIMIAKQYDLLWRNIAVDFDDFRQKRNFKLVAAAPYHQGYMFHLDNLKSKLYGQNEKKRVDKLINIINHLDMNIQQLCLSFLLQDEIIDRIVIGVESVEELSFMRYDIKKIDEIIYKEIYDNGFLHEAMSGIPFKIQN